MVMKLENKINLFLNEFLCFHHKRNNLLFDNLDIFLVLAYLFEDETKEFLENNKHRLNFDLLMAIDFKEKMDLIKKKGLNLQDLLDVAMDIELELNDSITKSSIDIFSDKIIELQCKRDEAMVDYQKRIDLVLKMLHESKEKEKEYYDRQIDYLESKIEYLKKQLDND